MREPLPSGGMARLVVSVRKLYVAFSDQWMRVMWNRSGAVGLLALLMATVVATDSTGADDRLERRWVYLSTNLQVKENLEPARAILRRAKAAGYNGVVLADFK